MQAPRPRPAGLGGVELSSCSVLEAQRPGGSSAQATTPLRELPPEHPQFNNLPVRWKHLRPTLGPNALKSALAAQDNESEASFKIMLMLL